MSAIRQLEGNSTHHISSVLVAIFTVVNYEADSPLNGCKFYLSIEFIENASLLEHHQGHFPSKLQNIFITKLLGQKVLH
jgi:hypothetical protein